MALDFPTAPAVNDVATALPWVTPAAPLAPGA